MTRLKKNRGTNQGKGLGIGEGKGRNKGGSYSVGGYCICAKCGAKMQHEQSVKCTTVKCPNCGHTMVREALLKNKLSKD